jgi:hypothetical protein
VLLVLAQGILETQKIRHRDLVEWPSSLVVRHLAPVERSHVCSQGRCPPDAASRQPRTTEENPPRIAHPNFAAEQP